MDHFVPHWHFSATSRSVRLEDSMPNSDATVWIHLRYTIVLIQPRLQNKHTKYPVDSPFSALTLLVGREEGHPAGKKTGCWYWFVGGDDLTGAMHNL